MEIKVTVSVPEFIYDLYTRTAQILGNGCSTEDAMSGALQAYAQYLFEDLRAKGELPDRDAQEGDS